MNSLDLTVKPAAQPAAAAGATPVVPLAPETDKAAPAVLPVARAQGK